MAKKVVLSREEILHLAKLAKLNLTEDEIKEYKTQLEETIDYVKNLDELDTKNIKPTNSVVDLENVTFEDGIRNEKALTPEEAFSNSKKVKNDKFVVDRILG